MTDTEGRIDRLVDLPELQAYLETELGEADEFEVSYHEGGDSNETLFLVWGDRDLVLRRPPAGDTAKTAHNVLREYRVLSALTGTDVPVPNPVLACEDPSIIGKEFYLMERLNGDVIGVGEPERFTGPAHRRRIGEEVINTLICIHSVDVEEVSLGDFGHPEGYTRRQVNRWSEQFEWAESEMPVDRKLPRLHDVRRWLTENVPDTRHHTLVHGDYRLDNLLFRPGTPPELAGVLDWELSTLGDPLTDLGFLLVYWPDADDPWAPVVPEWTATFTAHEDYHTRRELVDIYERRTRFRFERDQFYRALAVYKGAVAGEMLYLRSLKGESTDPLYERMGDYVPKMANRALRIIEGREEL